MTKETDPWEIMAMIAQEHEDAPRKAMEYLDSRIERLQGIEPEMAEKIEGIAPERIEQAVKGLPNIGKIVDKYLIEGKDAKAYDAVHSATVGLSLDSEAFYQNIGMLARWEDIMQIPDGVPADHDGAQYWFEDIFGYERAEKRAAPVRDKRNSGPIQVYDLTKEPGYDGNNGSNQKSSTEYSFRPADSDSDQDKNRRKVLARIKIH